MFCVDLHEVGGSVDGVGDEQNRDGVQEFAHPQNVHLPVLQQLHPHPLHRILQGQVSVRSHLPRCYIHAYHLFPVITNFANDSGP